MDGHAEVILVIRE